MAENKTLGTRVIKNTLSNYGSLGISMIVMAFLMRIQYTNIPYQDYGFWSLIWSIFGYSLLLDFGFGVSVQKYTSEVSVTGDWEKYNNLISTIFYAYCILAVVLAAIVIGLSFKLDVMFNFQEGSDINYYRQVFLIFGIGTSILFPFGFFSEMLTGMQLIQIRNRVHVIFTLINFGSMAYVILSGYGLIAMVYVSIGTHIVKNIAIWFFTKRNIPELSIKIAHAKFHMLKEVTSFSMFAYLITFSNIIVFNTDQIVISAFASVELVALYQAAAKIAQIFKNFSTQFNENLGPLAAIFHTSAQHEKLAEMQITTARVVSFIATLMVVPLMIYIKPLLALWLELTAPETFISAIILLGSMYFYVIFRSGSIKILLMIGKEKKLSIAALIECFGNLLISIILIGRLGIVGVAIGTMIPNILVGIFYNIPASSAASGLPIWEFIRKGALKTIVAGIIAAGLSYLLLVIYEPKNLLILFVYCCLSCLLFIITYLFIGLTSVERASAKNMVLSKIKGA